MPCYIAKQELVELTKNAVESFGDVELIIIDDNSPQGGGYLRSIADIYVKNKENLGYGRSVNRGLKLATSQYIAIANNDVRISSNWQEVTEEVFSKDELIYSCHFRMTPYDEPFKYGNTIAIGGRERWCHASFFVINKAKVLFYYDEEYTNTYDDWDLFQTVRSSGLKQAYTDKAQFQHKDSSTIPYMENHGIKNKDNLEYFKDKWGMSAEELFAKDFPEQMKVNWRDGFKL